MRQRKPDRGWFCNAPAVGAWLGTRVYHALNDRNFRDVVLGLLFLSGVVLLWSSLGVR